MTTNQEVLEVYCKIVLHPGCGIVSEEGPGNGIGSKAHKWEECPGQFLFRRIARKHQHKLKSNGLAIGLWIDESKFKLVEI